MPNHAPFHPAHVTFFITPSEYEALLRFLPPDCSLSSGMRELIFSRMGNPDTPYCECEHGEENRTRSMAIMLTEDEHKEFLQYVDFIGGSISSVVRKLIFGRRK